MVPEFGSSWSIPASAGYVRAAELILLGAPIDARHAGWIRTLAGVDPVAPMPTDPGIGANEMRARLDDLGVMIGG